MRPWRGVRRHITHMVEKSPFPFGWWFNLHRELPGALQFVTPSMPSFSWRKINLKFSHTYVQLNYKKKPVRSFYRLAEKLNAMNRKMLLPMPQWWITRVHTYIALGKRNEGYWRKIFIYIFRLYTFKLFFYFISRNE